jgi:hypothetical protein
LAPERIIGTDRIPTSICCGEVWTRPSVELVLINQRQDGIDHRRYIIGFVKRCAHKLSPLFKGASRTLTTNLQNLEIGQRCSCWSNLFHELQTEKKKAAEIWWKLNTQKIRNKLPEIHRFHLAGDARGSLHVSIIGAEIQMKKRRRLEQLNEIGWRVALRLTSAGRYQVTWCPSLSTSALISIVSIGCSRPYRLEVSRPDVDEFPILSSDGISPHSHLECPSGRF